MNSKERSLSVIKGGPVDRPPVFPLLMFFAQQRLGVTYREFATNGEVLAEAQFNMRRKFSVDAVTVCSDAFRIAADLGADMVFPDDKPPFASAPLVRSEADFRKLGKPHPMDAGSRMADRILGTKAMVDALGDECLVLGWVDMPFAEACSLCGVTEFMLMLVDNPAWAHKVLDFLTDLVIDFSLAQIQVGAPMIGADVFNVDHLVDFGTACAVYGQCSLCFKGNINPVAGMLQATPEECERRCHELLRMAAGLRYMLSPGCEVPGETPDDVFRAFCEAPQTI